MRSRSAVWFECKIRYEKTQEDGSLKKTTETYVVNALSFTEAEKRIMDEMSSYISGAFEVKTIKIANYKEIFFSDNGNDDKFYKAKLAFITIDEKTEKEKRSSVTYLVQANSLENARKNIGVAFAASMIDDEIKSVVETPIMDVYEYKKKEETKTDK